MSSDAPDVAWQAQAEAAREAIRRRRVRPLDLNRSLLVLAGLIFFAFLAFVVGLALGVRGSDVPMLGLAAVTFVVALVPFAVDLGRERSSRHVFLSLVCIIFIGSYVLPVLTRYIPAQGPIDAPAMEATALLPGDLVIGQLVVLLSLVSIISAYWLPVGRFLASVFPRPRIEWPLPTILVLAIVMMVIGWPLRVLAGLGVVPVEFGTGVVGTLYKGCIFSNAILMLAWIRHRSLFALSLMLVNLVLGLLVGLLQASKTEVLIHPITMGLTWVVVHRSFPLRWVAAGVVGLMVLYPSVSFVRALQEEGWTVQRAFANPVATLSSVSQNIATTDRGEWLATGLESTINRTDGLGVATVLIRDTPRISPFLHGESLMLFFYAFVPRVLWEDKPIIGLGQFITSTYGSGPQVRSNTAVTQIGDFYINFGTPGVVGGMVLLGLLMRFAHEALLWRGGTAASILTIVVIMYSLTIAFEANVGLVYSSVAFAIIPIWLATLLARAFLPTYVRRLDDGSLAAPDPTPTAIGQSW